jgi:hypothetical protein
MTGKERVTATLNHEPADKIPLGFYAVDYDTIEKVIGHKTYVRNKIEIQIALWEGRRDEIAQSLVSDTIEFYKKIDCADLLLPKEAQLLPPKNYQPDPPKKIDEDKWEDKKGRIFKAVRHANEIGCIYDPTIGKKEFKMDDFTGKIDFEIPDPTIFEVFDAIYEYFGEERYVAGFADITAMTLLDGTENGLMTYITNPDLIHAFNKRSVEIQNYQDKFYFLKGDTGVLMEQDMAGTNGPLLSPKMFNEFCYPYLKQRIQNVKKYVPHVIFHSCGNNLPLMDMYIDCGIDCYQSLQTNAGMEIGLLKRKYGKDLVFWGGIPVEELIAGTPDDIRKSVRTAMEKGKGGSFILGPSHSIAKNTKYENFMALLDEFDKLNK